MPGGVDGSVDALRCAACDCHRNFHRHEVEGEPLCNCKRTNKPTKPVTKVTPPRPQFRQWLIQNPAPTHGTELEGMLEYLQEVPCSPETKKFIEGHLYQVPDITNVHFDVVASLGGNCFWRDDIFKLLKSNKSNVLILSGRRRIGKTMAMAHEVIRARSEIYGVRDSVLFYHPGGKVLEAHVQTIIKILAHMNIPCLWDEFTDLEVNLAKEYKILFESCLNVPRLCAVLFGSSEAAISDKSKGSFSAVASRGAGVSEVPLPSMELLLAMLQHRKPNLNSYEIGSTFLRNFSVYGFNLSSHMEEDADVASLESIRAGGIHGVCFLTGTRLEALEQLASNRNKVDGISAYDLIRLEQNQYIEKRATGGHYDFRDPQLIGVTSVNSTLEDVEGYVFELLLRDFLKPQLFQFLIEKFPLLEGLEATEAQMIHGNLTKNCEIDGLIFYREYGIILSCKRSQGLQDWDKSFLDHLNHLSDEGKKQSPKVHRKLALCQRLFLVCVSVLDGETRGLPPSSYNHANLSLEEKYISGEKEISPLTIFLHDLLALLPPVKMAQSSCSWR
ncbi:hypothetical protein KC19_3G260900 [Ceratodon purpureus]|uniref:ZF-HD dimerization-type domain-containing protein n=1 Tax=Ceratodon purpureus TaxID=3225 RepID=A0A8T0IQ43_CERPU|nr:hypothetical protein KC19_3G260900 [Ceratodon purpureus]